MTDPAEAVSQTLAVNLRTVRQARGWRLEDLASRSGVSRGMLQQIETVRTNPSITTLARICATLGISIGELVEPPEELGRVARADDAVVRSGGRARLLINDGQAPFTELWDFRLPPGDEIRSDAHPVGTRELLHVHEGTLAVTVGGALFQVGSGDALRMRGDRPHVYANPGSRPVRLTMTVVYAGTRDPRYAELDPHLPTPGSASG
ncbi:helix-turn-helix domain-containing protein [Actinomadura sp. HBU206391]|uniref:helix-turn-helix domain-containing protein n=1 Tax=Actinomadura sp. HBU206391 TaxID=2731692 RepID=UPI00165092BF|nr:XRE family transcriptional regulator [Actinomadura sp. HBU206391]MBC6462556.1 helix-turn-helix transcriptional regulator [Actinomadura sp. HBU206391]